RAARLDVRSGFDRGTGQFGQRPEHVDRGRRPLAGDVQIPRGADRETVGADESTRCAETRGPSHEQARRVELVHLVSTTIEHVEVSGRIDRHTSEFPEGSFRCARELRTGYVWRGPREVGRRTATVDTKYASWTRGNVNVALSRPCGVVGRRVDEAAPAAPRTRDVAVVGAVGVQNPKIVPVGVSHVEMVGGIAERH